MKRTAKQEAVPDPRTVSDAHVWRVVWQDPSYSSCTEQCQRCGASFVPKADTYGPPWCPPIAVWLKDHPTDDGAWRRDGIRSPMEPRRSKR
jgi:hypothetical protein